MGAFRGRNAFTSDRWSRLVAKHGLNNAYVELPDWWAGYGPRDRPKFVPCFVSQAHNVDLSVSDRIPVTLHAFGFNASDSKRAYFSPWNMVDRTLTGWAERLEHPVGSDKVSWVVKICSSEMLALNKRKLSCFVSEHHLSWYRRYKASVDTQLQTKAQREQFCAQPSLSYPADNPSLL